MKLLYLSRQVLMGLFLFAIILNMQAQSSSLIYKVKGKNNFTARIDFTSESGSSDLDPEDFFSQSNLYFTLTADPNNGKGIFKDSDIEDIISKVSILQNEKSIKQSGMYKTLLNPKNRIDKVIIAFSKSEVNVYDELAFSVSGFFSDKINIDEKYFESYESSKNIYDKAIEALEADQYIEAFHSLFSLYNQSITNPEVEALSFYQKVLDKLDESVKNFISKAEIALENSHQEFIEKGTEESLNEFREQHTSIKASLKEFEQYLNAKLSKAKILASRVEELNATTEKQLNESIQLFKGERMAILIKKDFSDYQFSTYVNLLANLLIDADSLWILDKLNPIDLKKADQFMNERTDLYDNQKQDFRILVGLINDNIEHGFVLDKDVIENLENNVEFQKQPYLEIFIALNALENDKNRFQEYLKIALAKCSDMNMLKGLELWQLSFLLTKDGIGDQIVSKINEGARLIAKKRWKQAEDQFIMLKRQLSGFAPIWYYSGELKYNMGEPYSAEIQFKRALSIHTEYIAPRRYILDIFENDSSYNQLLANAEEAISTFDTWLFRYYKAKALVYLKKYDLAIDELLNFCIPKNNWDLNQYYLLGDAYLALNKFEEAKAAYTKTQEIDPYSLDSKHFDDKMRMVYKKANNYTKPTSKSKVESDTSSVNK